MIRGLSLDSFSVDEVIESAPDASEGAQNDPPSGCFYRTTDPGEESPVIRLLGNYRSRRASLHGWG